MNCCDECYYYQWYYDYCEKWECIMDPRFICDCFQAIEYNNRPELTPYKDCKYSNEKFDF